MSLVSSELAAPAKIKKKEKCGFLIFFKNKKNGAFYHSHEACVVGVEQEEISVILLILSPFRQKLKFPQRRSHAILQVYSRKLKCS